MTPKKPVAKTPTFKKMMDASGNRQVITIGAKLMLIQARPLKWVNPHSPDGQRGISDVYEPRVDEDGVIMYQVPLPYARRLLSAEPYKFVLVAPDVLRLEVKTKNGGKEMTMLQAMVPKYEYNITQYVDDAPDIKIPRRIVKDSIGVPEWCTPEEDAVAQEACDEIQSDED